MTYLGGKCLNDIMFAFTRSSVIHPVLFAIIPVLLIISLNLDEIVLQDVVFPFSVIVVSTVVLWYLLNRLLKNNMKSGLIVSLGLVAFFMYGHFFNIFNQVMVGDFDIGRHRYLLTSFLLLFGVCMYFILRSRKDFTDVTTIVNVVAIVILSISVFNISAYALQNSSSDSNEIFNNLINERSLPTVMPDYTPNVYYVILDQYTSSKVLESVYGFDNSDFIAELTARGFYVSSNSHSNYPSTFLSLASSLNMQYLNDLVEKMGGESSDRRLFYKLWNDNKIINIFDSYNYTTVTIPFDYGISKISDYELCQGTFLLNEVEVVLLESTMLKPVLATLDLNYREQILCGFSELSNLHNSVEEPFFVYAHFLLPHPPFMFGPNGEPMQPESLAPGAAATVWEDKSKYLNQVKFANKKVIETVDKILHESDTPPIIILQGDHGTPRSVLPDDAQDWSEEKKFEEGIRNRMSILNAYYLPDGDIELIYDGITPVNSFRVILNNYFDAEWDLLEDKIYVEEGNSYNLTDVTDILVADSIND